MISTDASRRGCAVAHVAITLANVRDNQPDDETLAAIAWEIVADVERALAVPKAK